MNAWKPSDFHHYLQEKIRVAKVQFERTVECKHTEFDDLYPYMVEHPQFFWYKRYVAWSELLAYVKMAEELGVDWKSLFAPHQVEFIQKRILEGKVLNEWFGETAVMDGEFGTHAEDSN